MSSLASRSNRSLGAGRDFLLHVLAAGLGGGLVDRRQHLACLDHHLFCLGLGFRV